MTRYTYLDNGEISEIHDSLPVSWKNYSNFNLMDSQALKELGWLPIVEATDAPPYDSVWQRIDARYINRGDYVEAFYVILPWDPQTDAEIKDTFMRFVRDRRNSRLSGTDWTMLPDTAEIKGQAWIDSWKAYRQQLRDFPSAFETMQTSELPSIDSIAWPEPPAI